MNKLTILTSILLMVIIIGCLDAQHKVHPNPFSQRIEGKYPTDINSRITDIDTNLNPFKTPVTLCNCHCDYLPDSERITCIYKCFDSKKLPLHFGPIPEIKLNSNQEIKDSIFITKALQDTNYFHEEERQYSYYTGISIPADIHFNVVVLPYWYSVGKSYILYTFTKSGEYIDSLVIGLESADEESVFGKLESLNHIEITTKKIGYDEENDLLYFASSETSTYYINELGKIIKE